MNSIHNGRLGRTVVVNSNLKNLKELKLVVRMFINNFLEIILHSWLTEKWNANEFKFIIWCLNWLASQLIKFAISIWVLTIFNIEINTCFLVQLAFSNLSVKFYNSKLLFHDEWTETPYAQTWHHFFQFLFRWRTLTVNRNFKLVQPVLSFDTQSARRETATFTKSKIQTGWLLYFERCQCFMFICKFKI